MTAYYNEWEKYPAQWLRNLADAGQITPGTVDERSITDVQPADLDGFTRAHFFAGIGGWEEALRLAGWPAQAPVWTGSCPCQPFSSAGLGGGAADERHLWPAFHRLIAECRPPVVFGEQVASAAGRSWLTAVRADLEALGYAVGAADLCAAGVGAPHIRQRLYWGAWLDDSASGGRWRAASDALQGECAERGGEHAKPRAAGELAGGLEGSGSSLPDAYRVAYSRQGSGLAWFSEAGGSGDAATERLLSASDDQRCGEPDGVAHRISSRLEGREGERGDDGWECQTAERGGGAGADGLGHAASPRREGTAGKGLPGQGWTPGEPSRESGNPWSNPEWLPCSDGKARPTQPGIFPLAHGLLGRVGQLRAAGNAIVPQVAAQFVMAFMGAIR